MLKNYLTNWIKNSNFIVAMISIKILLEIDKKNYDIIPETGDYNRFHYLSKKQYEALSKEDREKYDKEKAEYEEKKEKYIGQNSAASITL